MEITKETSKKEFVLSAALSIFDKICEEQEIDLDDQEIKMLAIECAEAAAKIYEVANRP